MSQGITETKEALQAVIEVTMFLSKRMKDGIDFQDAIALWEKFKGDTEFVDTLKRAYDKAEAIPAEVSDLDLAESVELAQILLGHLPALVAGFQK